ncbi:hypothetical protein F5879DRAFT_1067473 [Lentinula edodes]|nr:hypothetical protein F5879DRAFT_1067473 [Lentinula edodes]
MASSHARNLKKAAAARAREGPLKDIEKLLASKKDSFVNGHDGLQATRARSIRSTLTMVVEKKKGLIDASHIAAEANNFSLNWGSRCIRQWTQNWIKTRVLPQSSRGRHTKVYSLLSEPAARDAIRGYLRTNKWSVNPPRLKKLFANELAPDEAREYAKQIISQEMPRGLKGFVEEHLLPRMQCRPGRFGLSLSSMRRLMLREGFKKGWVLEGEQPLKKKGPGQGIHQSDFICSTVGWLKDASVTLEYGKNHKGYWNCELFIRQQCRMRNGWFIRNGQHIDQPMIFPTDHPVYPDEPKGMQQRYLREHCDYTFKTLPSIQVELIRKWEHRAWRFIDAYGEGLGAKDAVTKVKQFSSRRYTSHRRIPESLAQAMDQ